MRKIKKFVNTLIVMFISFFFSFKKKNENKIVFISDTRTELGGNLKYMYDYIPDSYEKVVILKADRRSKRTYKDLYFLFKNLSSAKYIFLEDLVGIMSFYRFTKNQEIIQLWHGPGAFKKFGYSRLIENGGDLKRVHRGYKKYTKAIVSSESIRKDYAFAFGIPVENVRATGFLRTDYFFDNKYIEKIKKDLYKKYPEFKNKKIVLFAPTYRGVPYKDVSLGGAYYDFDKLDFDNIYKELKNDYIFILKWHPALYNNIKNGQIKTFDFNKYNDFYYDLSEYRDINDLLLITDVLVTDYSSVIFDYSLLNKPIIYFTYDLEEYENGRGLYYPFKDYVYGDIAKNNDELVRCIKKTKIDSVKHNKFIKKFMSACDGNSIKKTFEWIFNNKIK